MKRSLQLTALLALAVAACMMPTDEHADVEADVEPLTTCSGELCSAIAADMGINTRSISAVALRRSWGHVP